MLSLFRYSGNKGRLIDLYRRPPEGTKRIVELYLGSGAYGLNTDLPCLGYEINKEMAELWRFFIEAPADVAQAHMHYLDKLVKTQQTSGSKVDVRTLNMPAWAKTYVRLNVCSAMVGQLSSWRIYPQHNLPIEKTLQCINKTKQFEVRNENCSNYIEQEGDLVFIDPPYTTTSANYMEGEVDYHPQQTIDLIGKIKSPIIFTYGSNATELFPDYDWIVVKERQVPNLRRGGTTSRLEHVCYINW